MIRNVNYNQAHKNIKPQSTVQIRLAEEKTNERDGRKFSLIANVEMKRGRKTNALL